MDGIVGIYGIDDNELVYKAFLATGACQHRGKASTGLAVGNNKGIYINKGLGRIAEVIDYDLIHTFKDLEPVAAIGNIGYTKRRRPEKVNAEPIQIDPLKSSTYKVVLTMDGTLINEKDIRAELENDYRFNTGNMTEIMGSLLHKYIDEEGISFEAGRRLMDKIHGRATFALVALVFNGKETCLLALNDDRAFEPFCCGQINGTYLVSSESCSHRRLGGQIEREYEGAAMPK